MKKDNRKKVVIVYGGESAEHDISIITAITIFKKYKMQSMDINLLYCSRDGKFYLGEKLDDFKIYKNFKPNKLQEVIFIPKDNFLYAKKKGKLIKLFDIDFVINCFHGGAGEDGRFVAMLENCKIPASCANFKALGIAMDKYLTKNFALSLDVPVVDFFSFSYTEWVNTRERVLQQLMQFDFPVVVKPVSQGSSIGVSLATTMDEFNKCVNLAFKFDQSVMVERAILNKREFNCCVVRSPEGKMLAKVDEPVSDNVIISFSDKYLGGQTSKKGCKASGKLGMQMQAREAKDKITAKQKAMLVKHSRLLYDCLDMNGVVRFDYIMDAVKDKFYLGEINAVPGSLGYYFFDDLNLLKVIYDASKSYWGKRFSVGFEGAPTIFTGK